MGKYHAYPDYKESGSKWLDSIPSHWEVTFLKHVLSTPITDGPHSTPVFLDEGIPFVSAEAVSGGYIDFGKIRGFISKEDDAFFSQKYSPQKHDVYMIKSGATTGITAIVETDKHFNIWSPLAVMRCKSSYNPYFLLNSLRSDYFQKSVQLSWTFGTQQNIGMGTLENLSVCYPPLEEQVQIANFLDHETAKIDTLIEKQQQLIKLLKEKRQAVISHAVTKGLNSDALMKDSGVEWLGEVPEHWQIVSVRNLIRGAKLKIQDGNHGELHPVANDYVDDGIPFLMANNVKNGKADTTSCKRIPKALADKLRIGFAKAGDMLLTHKGTVGEVCIVPDEMSEEYWMLTPQVTYYRWLTHTLSNQFFYYQFQSTSVVTQLDVIAGKQSTRGYVGLIAQGDVELVVPPINEQQEINLWLNTYVKRYQDIIQKAENLVTLQMERRTALISAAVTGKIDVRNWQAPVSQKAQQQEAGV